MSFNPAIPQPTDRLSKSQQDLLQNNQQLDTTYKVDHIPLTQPTNNGFHKKTSFVERTVDPVPPAGVETLYTKLTGTPAAGELFYVRNGGTPIQMTGPYNPVTSGKGYTFLPGGMLLQWGFINSTASSYTQLLFATNNINFPNSCRYITTQPYSSGSVPNSQATVTIRDSTISNLGFQWAFITNSASYTGFYWTAIGF
jgi:hypothetical protein